MIVTSARLTQRFSILFSNLTELNATKLQVSGIILWTGLSKCVIKIQYLEVIQLEKPVTNKNGILVSYGGGIYVVSVYVVENWLLILRFWEKIIAEAIDLSPQRMTALVVLPNLGEIGTLLRYSVHITLLSYPPPLRNTDQL